MGNSWTVQQKQAIDLRNRSILVSAAAGSGKTAVLVERIVNRIALDDNPIDLDELLVVTFTRAAAAQMRERIRKALLDRLSKDPGNQRLSEQLTLVPYAHIETIDSFCKNVVADHFEEIEGLDPGFRIADSAELKMIMDDVLSKIMTEHYALADEAFLRLTDTFGDAKGDQELCEMIIRINNYSASAPWPLEWLNQCKDGFVLPDALDKCKWLQFYLTDFGQMLEGYIGEYDQMLAICKLPGGPENYIDVFTEDKMAFRQLQLICQKGDFDALLSNAKDFKFGKKPNKNLKLYSEDLDTRVTNIRKSIKIRFDKIISKLPESVDEIRGELAIVQPIANILLDLVIEFQNRLMEAKKKKNLVDFSDLEHFALDILTEHSILDDGTLNVQASEIGRIYQRQFQEVMIDEYQDSNLIQEIMLQAISGEKDDRPNRFMVGDVKQSIYRFRMARPSIFMEKYDQYESSPDDASSHGIYQKIELAQNFRSRSEVLEAINEVFYDIMMKSIGGIQYTDECALHPAAVYPDYEDTDSSKDMPRAKLLLLKSGENGLAGFEEYDRQDNDEITASSVGNTFSANSDNDDEDASAEDLNSIELEAKMIAIEIQKMLCPENGYRVTTDEVKDEQLKKASRPVKPKDICILLRSCKGYADTYVEILKNYGIAAVSDNQEGYLDTYEVRLVLDLLRIIDNPRQDIPLLGVMKSVIGGFSLEDLALLKMLGPGDSTDGSECYNYYDYLQLLMEHGDPSGSLYKKTERFINMLSYLRREAILVSVHDLLLEIFEMTDLAIFIQAMPAGAMRIKNLDVLLDKTLSFEQTSYHGLFSFIRYVENVRKYEMEFAEPASAQSDSEYGVVHIMSIHKSKGLEFPVVFVAACSKKFNLKDLQQKYSLVEDYGLALPAINVRRHAKYPSFMLDSFRLKLRMDTLGEELRLLYVAMTRAKEYLIITAANDKMDDLIQKAIDAGGCAKSSISYSNIASSNSYLEWLLYVFANKREFRALPGHIAKDSESIESVMEQKRITDGLFCIEYMNKYQLLGEREEKEIQKMQERLFVLDHCEDRINELKKTRKDELDQIEQAIEDTYEFQYPFEKELIQKANISVSELKHAAIEEAAKQNDIVEGDMIHQELFGSDAEDHRKVPKFILDIEETKTEDRMIGALRGTAYHNLLECLDFKTIETKEDIEEQMKQIISKGRLTSEEAKLIRISDIETFFNSELGQKMKSADQLGKLYKEQQFIIGFTKEEFDEICQNGVEGVRLPYEAKQLSIDENEHFIMVQGIIDGFFYDKDRLILMDYKTDRVNSEKELADRYYTQLQYYDIALERMTGKQCDSWWLYSFSLKKPIRVEKNKNNQ